MDYKEAIDTYLNGNISDFKEFLKNCSRKELLMMAIDWEEYTGKSTTKLEQIFDSI